MVPIGVTEWHTWHRLLQGIVATYARTDYGTCHADCAVTGGDPWPTLESASRDSAV